MNAANSHSPVANRGKIKPSVASGSVAIVACSLAAFISFVSSAEKPKKKKIHEVFITAARLTYNNKTKDVFADGNVKMQSRDMTLLSEKIYYNTNTKMAKVDVPFKLFGQGNTFTGNKVEANFKEKVVKAYGNVKFVQKKRKSGKKPEKKEEKGEKITSIKSKTREDVTITCDQFVYNYDSKEGTAEGNVKLYRADGVITGDHATYSGKPGLVVVTGNVKVEKTNGDWLTCKKATVSLKEDWVEAEGDIKSKIRVEEKEEEKKEEKKDVKKKEKTK